MNKIDKPLIIDTYILSEIVIIVIRLTTMSKDVTNTFINNVLSVFSKIHIVY